MICDEAVSALDKSIQASVLNLLAELQATLGVAYIFVSHDLAVVEHMSDRVLVMRMGQIVEEGARGELWHNPKHEYTRQLLSAIPGWQRHKGDSSPEDLEPELMQGILKV